MKPHKLILKLVYGLIGLSIISVIALTVYQQQQIKKLRGTESLSVSERNPSPGLPGDSHDMETARRNAGTEKGPAPEPDGSTDASEDADTLDGSYAALFKKLALSPVKQKAVKALLLDLQMKKADLNMEMLDTSLSEEKRDEIQKRLESIMDETNQKIHIVLGTDSFEKYLTYEERLDERTLLAAFFESLPPGEKLAESREQAFIDAMFEERKRIEAAHPRDNAISSAADLEMQIAGVMETMDRTHSGYITMAGMYLPPSRIGEFSNFLKQRRDMMEVSLNVMRQVFGSDPATNQPMEEPESPDN